MISVMLVYWDSVTLREVEEHAFVSNIPHVGDIIAYYPKDTDRVVEKRVRSVTHHLSNDPSLTPDIDIHLEKL